MTPAGAFRSTADVVIIGGGVTGCSIAFHSPRGVRTWSSSSGGSWPRAGRAGRWASCASSTRPETPGWCSTRCGSSRASPRSPGAMRDTCSAGPSSRSARASAPRWRGRWPPSARSASTRDSSPRRHPRARSAHRPLRGGRRGVGAGVGIRRSDRRDQRLRPGGARAGAIIEQGAEVVGSGSRRGSRGSSRQRRPDRHAGRRQRRRAVVRGVAAMAGVTLPSSSGAIPSSSSSGRRVRPATSGVPGPRQRHVPPARDRRAHAHRVPRRGRAEPSDGPRDARGEVGFDEVARIMERASRCMPALAEARYQRGYAGAFDITPDWMPILDQTPVRGLYVAAGMSGHGFKLSPAVGRLMADRILDGTRGARRPRPVPARPVHRRPHDDARRVCAFLPAPDGGPASREMGAGG